MIKYFIKVIKIVFNIAAYFISIVSEFHLFFGELNGLVYMKFMLLYELLLLLQDELNVFVMLLT